MTEAKGAQPLVSFNGSIIAIAHGIFAYSAFLGALVVGCYLHYHKIVQNGFYGHPDEWFPSVSATIGDRYPERSVFQVLIAVTSGPRFLLIGLGFVRLYKAKSVWPKILLITGLLRTFTCGGWVYITSTDDHDAHDVFMISYILLTLPYDISVIKLTTGARLKTFRALAAATFFGLLVPLVYWFIQHKVHRIAGAYSVYAYFEWSLVLLDIGFDCFFYSDLKDLTIGLTSNSIEFSKTVQKKKEQAINSDDDSKYSYLSFIVQMTNSFILWSMITSLTLCVWYFPLWHMGISGYEAILLCLLAPFVLVIKPLTKFYVRYPFITRVASVLFGLGSYKEPEPEKRLMYIGIGCAFAVISLATEIWSIGALTKNPKQNLKFYAVSFMAGLLMSSVIKFGFATNNPIWPIMHEANNGWNNTGIFVGLVSAILTPKQKLIVTSTKRGNHQGSLLLAALGFGGYFFAIQSMLADSSTIILWTWEGYPINGPMPVPHSLLTFSAMVLGMILSVKYDGIVSSFPYFIIGSAGAFVLLFTKEWTAYVGGFVYAVYLTSITPTIFETVVPYNVGLVFFLAFFFNIVVSLASVWVVAYAFVPGGSLLRERTDIVVAMSLLFVGAGVFNFYLINSKTVTFYPPNWTRMVVKKVVVITSILLAAGASFTFKRYPTEPFKPFNEESRSFTTGIWCIHFGLDNDMWASEIRMRDLIRDAQVDIIGLLESDTQRLIGGNRDITQTIADDLGMYVDYGPGPDKHTWGAALLSKFPIVNSTHHLLPSPVGELAPAIHATLDIYGELIDVVVFHSGQEEDVEDRRLQSLGVQEIMGNSTRPLVLLSYLVTEPLKGNYNTYVSEKSRMYDIDSTDWDRWCEYILFRDLNKVGYARISRSTITDTELQIAKFKLLSGEEKQHWDSEALYGNNYLNEEEVDENLRFPKMFYGDGVRDHRYHVFDEPRYFAH